MAERRGFPWRPVLAVAAVAALTVLVRVLPVARWMLRSIPKISMTAPKISAERTTA